MDRRSFLSLLGVAPVAAPLVARGEVPVEPPPPQRSVVTGGGGGAGGSGTVTVTGNNGAFACRVAAEPIAVGDFVSATADGRWAVLAGGTRTAAVAGVALASASPGQVVEINVAGVARVNVEA